MNANDVKAKMQRELGDYLTGGKLQVIHQHISEHDTFSNMAFCKDSNNQSTHLISTDSNLFIVSEMGFFSDPSLKRVAINSISFVESPKRGTLEIGVGNRTFEFTNFYNEKDLKNLLATL